MAAMTTQQPISMPTMQQPLILAGGMISQPWWRFLYGLFTRSAATVPYLTNTGLTATGTTQATALALVSQWNEITTTAANTGALLKAFGIGVASTVFNQGANTLKVYPPTGGQIDALGTNNPFSIATLKMQVFYQLSATQFRSVQL